MAMATATTRAAGIAIPVRAVREQGNNTEVRSFSSIKNAAGHFQVHHGVIRRHIARGAEYQGWRLAYVYPDEDGDMAPPAAASAPSIDDPVSNTITPVPAADAENTNMLLDPMTYFFGPEAHEILNGKNVRITNESPPRISVYDFIEVISAVDNPRNVWRVLTEQLPIEVIQRLDNFQFPGAGQRPTPVATLREAVLICNYLRGPMAERLRNRNAELTIDFIGGNEAKINAVAGGIAEFHRQGLAEGSMAALCREPAIAIEDCPAIATSVTTPATKVAKALAATTAIAVLDDDAQINRMALHSPSMIGRYLYMFENKNVVYLIIYVFNGETYIKLGSTRDIRNRMKSHRASLPSMKIWCIIDCGESYENVETKFKQRMSDRNFLIKLDVGGTEILKGIDASEAEAILTDTAHEFEVSNAIEIRKLEIEKDVKIAEMHMHTEMKKAEFKAAKLDAIKTLIDLMSKGMNVESIIQALMRDM